MTVGSSFRQPGMVKENVLESDFVSRRWSDLGLFMLCPSLSEHMAVSWYVFVMCSIVTPPLLLPYYLVRINTCFRSLVTLYIPLLFSVLCQIESLLC